LSVQAETGLVIIARIGTFASSPALLLDRSDTCICSTPGKDEAISRDITGNRISEHSVCLPGERFASQENVQGLMTAGPCFPLTATATQNTK
jgi:hypothetical protein